MKICVTKEFKNFSGDSILDGDGKPGTLGGVAIEALLASYNDEKALSGEEKMKRFCLAHKIHQSTATAICEASVEEVALIKKLIGKFYAPIIVGQAWQMLEEELT